MRKLFDADDDGPPTFDVLAENWDAVQLFQRTAHHWERIGLTGVPVGLKGEEVERRMRIMGCEHDIGLYDAVMYMGHVAAEELRKRFHKK